MMRRFGEGLARITGVLGWMVRIGLRLFVGGILLFIVLFVVLGLAKGCGMAEEPPSITEAPWLVQTSSLVYYAKEYSIQGDTSAIKDYWVLDGKHYKFYEGIKLFPVEYYGKVAIIRRTK